MKNNTIGNGQIPSQEISGVQPRSSCISQNFGPDDTFGHLSCSAVQLTVPFNRVSPRRTRNASCACRFGTSRTTSRRSTSEAGMPAPGSRVIAMPYDWLITNIRLQAYNGLHLAYLARMSQRPINIAGLRTTIRSPARTGSAAARCVLRIQDLHPEQPGRISDERATARTTAGTRACSTDGRRFAAGAGAPMCAQSTSRRMCANRAVAVARSRA